MLYEPEGHRSIKDHAPASIGRHPSQAPHHLDLRPAIGKEKGILNFWGWREDVMVRLCAKALEAGIGVEYVQYLIRERRLNPPMPPFEKGSLGGIEIEHWPWRLKIYTLGRFEVVKDGNAVQFTGKVQRKPLEMLKVIVAYGGQKVREWDINEALWPEADGEAGHSASTTLLSRLRDLVGHEAVLQKYGHLTLNPQLCWVDIWALVRLLNQAEKTDQADPFHDNLMEKILNLYQGPFLKEEAMPWAYSVRERLASKFIRYLRKRGRYLEQKGDYEQAITLLQGVEPSRETEALFQKIKAAR